MIYNNITDTIGNTPIVKLNKLAQGIKGTVAVKVEYFNPGNSVKDRMAIKMIDDAERDGRLKPGGTIIEGTSGNTGMGLALVALQRGYKCIFTMSDKQSKEKADILRAVGADVIICPTNVDPSDPRSYYSVSKRLTAETPNSIYPNQYDNPSNALAHYETTGPEIWEQTAGKVTVYACGVGTGGTICGASKYLKEQNPNVKAIGLDTYGSVFKKYKETGIFDEGEIYPYMTEGIGEDILPKNVDFDLIDEFVKVTDKDAALMTRRLAKEEGLFVGWSSGSAVHGALEWARENMKEDDLMVIILPDHGSRYLAKIYNDSWMKDHGFEQRTFATARDIITSKNGKSSLVSVSKSTPIGEAIKMLTQNGISQVPVTDGENIVGSLTDTNVLLKLMDNPELRASPVSEVMDKPFAFVGIDNTLDVLSSLIREKKALLVRDENNKVHILTQADLLTAMAG